jgi:DNA polymerase-3 subunit gamma/tau
LEQEHIAFESGAIALIARTAHGSMRDALSLMDQAIAFSAGRVEESVVRIMLGSIDQGYLFDLLVALRGQDGAALLAIADNMAERSVAFDAALQDLATLLHRIALVQTLPQAVDDDEPERTRLLELATTFTPEEVQLFYQIAIHGRDEIDLAPDEYAGFTMTLLRMLAFLPAKVSAQPSLNVPAAKVRPSAKPVAAERNTAPISRTDAPVESAANSHSASGWAMSDIQPDWGVLLNELNVQGMAQQLAKHCVLESFSDQQITLCLSQEHKHLQASKMATEKLQAALADYFAKPLKLNIVLGKTKTETPAVIEQQSKQLKQQQASDSIAQDDFVHGAQTELDAVLITESIKPIQ